jgi:hypothetical protein
MEPAILINVNKLFRYLEDLMFDEHFGLFGAEAARSDKDPISPSILAS